MALINCPECKKEISSEADFCPHCGKKAAIGESAIFVRIVIAFAGGCMLIYTLYNMGVFGPKK